MKTGKVELKPENNLGEIPQTGASDIPKNWQTIGFEPTWENINKALDEYKMPYRRASKPGDTRQLQYDDIKTEDGYAHPHHFIDGYVELDKNNVPVENSFRLYPEDMPEKLASEHSIVRVRELDAKSWLRATGLMEDIHQEIEEISGEDKKRSARWEKEAEKPVTFRELPVPRHKVAAAYETNSNNARKAETLVVRETYMGRQG